MCGRGVGILFEVRHAETRPGELVGVVGDLPELGAWDAYTSALQLHTGSACYPLWATLTPRQVEIGSEDGSRPGTPRAWEDSKDKDISNEASAELPPAEEEEADEWGSPRAPLRGGGFGHHPSSEFLHIQYKYVKDRRQLRDNGPSILWESCIANRSVAIPLEPGSVWIVSDAKFNESREPPKLTRTTLIEILARQNSLGVGTGGKRSHQRLADTTAPEWTGREPEEDLESHASSLTTESHHTPSTIGIFGNRISHQGTFASGVE